MIKRIFLFLLLFVLGLLTPESVFAHVLKTSGNIGGVLHVEPGDDPIAGEESYFFFELKDKSGQLNPQDCECTLSIKRGDQELYKADLYKNSDTASLSDAIFTFTFPGRDIYKVVVSGKPKEEGQFPPFELTYDVRVARVSEKLEGVTNQNSESHLSHIAIGVGGAALVLGAVFLGKKIKGFRSLIVLATLFFTFSYAVSGLALLCSYHMADSDSFYHQCCVPQPQAPVISFLVLEPIFTRSDTKDVGSSYFDAPLLEVSNKSPPIS